MSISEIEPSSSRVAAILSLETAFRAESASREAMFCPNLAGLPSLQRQKADELAQELQDALQSGQIEAFNAIKRHLSAWLKKHGEPVTQWNPLVISLSQPDALRERDLSGINLECVRLTAAGDAMVSLEGALLRNAACLCADFSRVTLQGADLTEADLRFVDLREGNLQSALLREANLEQAKLSLADLRGADLYGARLNGALLKQAQLEGSNLRKADLRHADGYQAVFRGADLRQADLRQANLFMADLSASQLEQADLREANMGFALLEGAKIQQARLAGLNLNHSDLSLSDLSGCSLAEVLLSRSILKNTILSGADLQGVDLSDCCALDTAQLSGAAYNPKTRFPKGFKVKKQHGLIKKPYGLLARLTDGLLTGGRQSSSSQAH